MKTYKTRCIQYAVINITDTEENAKKNEYSYIDIYGINGGNCLYKRFNSFEVAKGKAIKLYEQEAKKEDAKNKYLNYAVIEEWCIKRVYRNKVLKSKIIFCANPNFKY